jgi:hypothetical protein
MLWGPGWTLVGPGWSFHVVIRHLALQRPPTSRNNRTVESIPNFLTASYLTHLNMVLYTELMRTMLLGMHMHLELKSRLWVGLYI